MTLLLLGSSLLPATAVLGTWATSQRLTSGWLLAALIQLSWAVYGAFTGQWGFTAWGAVLAVFSVHRWIRKRREDDDLHAMA